jgi:peptide-methionine (R)-S-oxide reductase
MADRTHVTDPAADEEYRRRLTPEQYAVTRQGGTEPAFTGVYWDSNDQGVYRCVCCGTDLFRSDEKYDSGTGWPSFWAPVADDRLDLDEDRSFGVVRTEVRCATCGAHLGHVFPDGPRPTGQRYCMNSAALDLHPGPDRAAGADDA